MLAEPWRRTIDRSPVVSEFERLQGHGNRLTDAGHILMPMQNAAVFQVWVLKGFLELAHACTRRL